jgi:arginyl-tRNA synthetase
MKTEIRDALMKALEDYGMYEEDFVLDLEQPRDPSHGDVTTNVALILAKKLGRKPRELAGELAANLELDREHIESVEIAGPGFVNFRAAQRWWSECILEILEECQNFGRSDAGQGQKINVEFVSANPTGPMNIVSARAAAVGSALCRTLIFAGYRAHAEFYSNNWGRQVRIFGQSLRARYAESLHLGDVEFPEDGYQGAYVTEMAEALAASPDVQPAWPEFPSGVRMQGELDRVEGSPAQWMELEPEASSRAFGLYAIAVMVASQLQTCTQFGLSYDTWFLESDLHKNDRLGPVFEILDERGHIFEKDGAKWFRSTEFGDEKDRVLIKADGDTTYFLADIAYHASKHSRGWEKAIDFLGPDHHGHIARLEAAMSALGYDEEWLEVSILQQVNLILDGKSLEMSKRAGRLVTMDELINEVGADAAKYFFLARKNNSHLDFDLDLAKDESSENPVYYVKYAHARICSVLRNAQAKPDFAFQEASLEELDLLVHESERNLVRILPEFPEVVAGAARAREMSRITTYAHELAAAFHPFYHQCTILGDDDALSRARLSLCSATRVVLANAMALMGVEAPDRM